MQDTKELRNRIKSVSGMGKIIKAMEMVASSKIRKAQNRIFEARPFYEKLEDFIEELSHFPGVMDNPLIREHDNFESVLILGITADRGLCGGYNTGIIKLMNLKIQEYELAGKKVKVSIIGTKGKNHFKYTGRQLTKVYENLSDYPKFLDGREIANDLIASYLSDGVDRVELFYTRFKNAAEQQPLLKQILPIPLSDFKEKISIRIDGDKAVESITDFIFEPSASEVLSSLIPEYIYTCLLYTSDAADE